MTDLVHDDVLNAALNEIQNNADNLHLISRYVANQAYATVIGNSVATYALTGASFTQADFNDGRQLTCNVQTGNNATASTNDNVDSGTATAGSANSLTDTNKTFTVDEHAGRKVTITAGTGSGQERTIQSNTATVLTPDEDWTTAPDNTSEYQIGDNLHFAVVDSTATKVLWVSDETSDQQVTNGNPINTPAFSIQLDQ